jgi:ribosomal-protein-alanine N-acetyltransferase
MDEGRPLMRMTVSSASRHAGEHMRIETKRCILRPLVAEDAASIARHANDRDVWINLRDRFPHPYAEKDLIEYVERQDLLPRVLNLGIEVDGAAIGSITLMPGVDVERVSSEIGYWIGKEHWGRGIMTDALRAMTTYGFRDLGFHRIYAMAFARNKPSLRILEKAGYVKEGFSRRSYIKEGEIGDQCLYGAYDDTWVSDPI